MGGIQNVGSGITAGQAGAVVTETVEDVATEGDVTTVASGQPMQVGDKWGGVEKKATNPNAGRDGNWGPTDNTGNNQVDSALDKFAAANADNPAAIAACEAAAAAVQANPQAYINADGTLNEQAFGDLLTTSFAGVSNVVVPSQETIIAEGAQNQGTGPGEGVQQQTQGSVISTIGSGIAHNQLAGMGDGDVMAMAFIVMMEASKSAREDLKTIMDGVKLINKQKEGWRAQSAEMNKLAATCAGKNDEFVVPIPASDKFGLNGNTFVADAPGPDGGMVEGGYSYARPDGLPLTKKDIDNIKDEIKNKLDSLSEMGEMESLRLQMAMDRMSKLMSTLSNMLKKASDTGQSITQNIK